MLEKGERKRQGESGKESAYAIERHFSSLVFIVLATISPVTRYFVLLPSRFFPTVKEKGKKSWKSRRPRFHRPAFSKSGGAKRTH